MGFCDEDFGAESSGWFEAVDSSALDSGALESGAFCPMIGVCGGCSDDEVAYDLHHKTQEIKEAFGLADVESIASPPLGYRARGEFCIYKEGGESSAPKASGLDSSNAKSSGVDFAKADSAKVDFVKMDSSEADFIKIDSTSPQRFFLAMSARGANKRVKITSCPILLPSLQYTLSELVKHINKNPLLSHKLYAIEALGTRAQNSTQATQIMQTTQSAQMQANQSTQNNTKPNTTPTYPSIISLIYHKQLDSEFEAAAKALESKIQAHIIARSKNKKLIISSDRILDVLEIGSREYRYYRREGQFCQPNAFINPQMIGFIKRAIAAHKRDDLLEMYGGDGNFSIALADSFSSVLVTEVVKSASALIESNAALNGITNIKSVRLSAQETIAALRGDRAFFRLRGLDMSAFRFSHILIDPPRSGIGDATILGFIARFTHIIYISCNPKSLHQDLQTLCQTHKIERFCVFDQFPHTMHAECGVILRKKNIE